jgi:PPE-repeat protein
MALVSANFVGQKSGAIADIDAEYEVMWAQNAAAMHAYAESAARAVTIAPFPDPPSTRTVTQRNWGIRSAPDVLSAGREVMSVIPEALRRLSSPRTTFEASLSSITASLSKLTSVTAPSDFAIGHLNSMNKTAALRSLFPKPANRVDAGFGRGMPVGGLSVPRTWAAAAPTTERPRGDWVVEPIHLVALDEPPGEHAADIYGG